MRLAVISDIHGNLAALEAVLDDLAALGGADMTWCLGDLATFGPRPAACIRRVKMLAEADDGQTFKVIGGNTDRYLVTGERMPTPPAPDEAAMYQRAADWSVRDRLLNWGLSQLDFSDYSYLQTILGRELALEAPGFGRVIGYHAVPGDDEAMLLPETPDEQARDYLLDREGRLAVGGHIHRQMDRDLGGWRAINVGSVGLSFETPGLAQWGLFTFEDGRLTVDLRRIAYNLEAVVEDLQTAGHPAPDWFSSRLRPTA
mgnify:CR=1 FL=1